MAFSMRESLWDYLRLNSEGTRRMIIRVKPVKHMKPPPRVEGLMEKTKTPKERWLR